MAESKEKLFADFPIPSREEWLDKITVDLKGADFQKKLVWRTGEGFTVQPFYLRDDIKQAPVNESLPGEFPYLRGNKTKDNTWLIRQNIVCKNAEEANKEAKLLLEKGITSLLFSIKKELISQAFLDTLLSGIPSETEFCFKTCQGHTLKLAETLSSTFASQGRKPEDIKGCIFFDPIEKILIKGKDVRKLIPTASKICTALKAYPNFRATTVNSVTLTDAGAFCFQELGYALAWGNEYIEQMVSDGIDIDQAVRSIGFNFGIGGNYFMEIAKIRAARFLWSKITKKHGASPEVCKMNIAATTTNYNKTLFDSYVNLLRTQTETMSAALAGVDAILVRPFDSTYAESNEFSERLARNQQLLLKEECHLDTTVDAAGGSYYVETLTVSLAEQAWKLFLEVEEQGGMLSSLVEGTIQKAINDNNNKRHEAASKRREFILGTNQFPNFNEQSEGRIPTTAGECCGNHAAGHTCEKPFLKIETSRLASEFEDLRLQTEQSEHRPKVFMLTIGNLAMRQARAQFSCNFFACAGYEVVDNLGFDCIAEGVRQALEAKADIIVLCSSDDEYELYAPEAFSTLADRAIFVVAGAPICTEELRRKGIENFINVRSNQLETLREFNAKLGIK